jgi:hypothetical protein
MEIKGIWDENKKKYVASGYPTRQTQWVSSDGDNWEKEDGLPCDGEYFEGCKIQLLGGPRDGEWVS